MIELIIAIVIISILAAVALPRFAHIEGRAEKAVLLGALGSLRSTARITESAMISEGSINNGVMTIENKPVLVVNRFPVARANNISDLGPGAFNGILSFMELDGNLSVHYSDDSAVLDATSARTVQLILALNEYCIYYQPPSVLGDLPYYSDGVMNFDSQTNSCP